LAKIDVNPEFFKTLTVDQLADLLFGLNRAINANAGSAAGRRITKKLAGSTLSSIDKKILKALLESRGNPSSLQLSRELDIPLSTVQRRRKRLEDEFVNEFYSLQYEKFGKRQVTFIVSLGAVDKNAIANEILGLEKVIAVARTFGDGADLKVEAILESNQEFMETSEKIKAIPGIQKVCWFESLELLGRKKELDLSIVEGAV
jgi:DNA-binding Lrp family transcriptional regulator